MKTWHTFAGIGAAVTLAATIFLMAASLALAAPSWAVAIAASATQQNDNMTKLSVTAADDIPRKTDTSPDAVVGFAWADLDTGDVLVATIHPTFRDSAQNPDSWHLHAARLAGPVPYHDFCVQELYPNPHGGIAIQDSEMSVNIRNSEMPFETSDIDGAVGFVINPVPASAQCPAVFEGSGLAVDLTADPVGLS